MNAQVGRGEIWLRRASPERGDRKIRPVLVISPDWRHQCRPTVVVLPISTRVDLLTPLRLILAAEPATGLQQDSLLYCDDPTTLLISRLIERVGRVENYKVDQACARLLESLKIRFISTLQSKAETSDIPDPLPDRPTASAAEIRTKLTRLLLSLSQWQQSTLFYVISMSLPSAEMEVVLRFSQAACLSVGLEPSNGFG